MVTPADFAAFQQQLRQEVTDVMQQLRAEVNDAISERMDMLNSINTAGKQRIFELTGLAHEITGVKVAQKKGKQMVSLELAKKEEKTWHKLLGDASTKEVISPRTWRNLLPQRKRRRLTIRQYIVPSWQDRDGKTQFDTFSESILEKGDKDLRIRRTSCRFDE